MKALKIVGTIGRFALAGALIPQRVANRKYEEKNKEKRQAASGNFQTMIPRELFEEINAFLKERNMTKVDFIKKAYEYLKSTDNSGI